MTSRPRQFVAAVHLPPPVQGAAVASERFVGMLRRACEANAVMLKVERISADPEKQGMAHHLQRTIRVLTACGKVIVGGRSIAGLYISVDGGTGVIYSVLLSLTARVVGSTTHLHHHSGLCFGTRRRIRMRVLCWIAGRRARHIVGCDESEQVLHNLYGYDNADVVPLSWAVDSGDPSHSLIPSGPHPPDHRLVMGHLGNLSGAKGLRDVFETVEQLSQLGVEAELLLAGPPATDEDRALLSELLEQASTPVKWWGPVHGETKEAFLRSLDVFLLPSQYAHEYFPLVVGEAICRGALVVAYETPCLRQHRVGAAGLVVPRHHPFPTCAAAWVREAYVVSGPRPEAKDAMQAFRAGCEGSRRIADHLAEAMVQGHGTST